MATLTLRSQQIVYYGNREKVIFAAGTELQFVKKLDKEASHYSGIGDVFCPEGIFQGKENRRLILFPKDVIIH